MTFCVILVLAGVAVAEEPEELEARLREKLSELNDQVSQRPNGVDGYSARGDVRFFLGEFAGAVEDYSKMVELVPSTDTSHWRRGIAFFYAGRFADAAAQFERYHAFDNVDRENGIWRYLSMYKAHGQERARQELLRYEKDDREPFGDVYRLFSGEISPDQILQRIRDAEIPETEREKRRFYAELYIGLNELVEGRTNTAREHLAAAVACQWPRRAGYGPHYMWQVARVQAALLSQPQP